MMPWGQGPSVGGEVYSAPLFWVEQQPRSAHPSERMTMSPVGAATAETVSAGPGHAGSRQAHVLSQLSFREGERDTRWAGRPEQGHGHGQGAAGGLEGGAGPAQVHLPWTLAPEPQENELLLRFHAAQLVALCSVALGNFQSLSALV